MARIWPIWNKLQHILQQMRLDNHRGGEPEGNDINNGQINISDEMNALKIIGAGTSDSKQVYVDGSATILEDLTVRGICDFNILSANAVGNNILNVI